MYSVLPRKFTIPRPRIMTHLARYPSSHCAYHRAVESRTSQSRARCTCRNLQPRLIWLGISTHEGFSGIYFQQALDAGLARADHAVRTSHHIVVSVDWSAQAIVWQKTCLGNAAAAIELHLVSWATSITSPRRCFLIVHF